MSTQSNIILGAAAAALVGVGVVVGSGGSSPTPTDAGISLDVGSAGRVVMRDLAPHVRTRPHGDAAAWLARHPNIATRIAGGVPIVGVTTAGSGVSATDVAASYDIAPLYSNLWTDQMAPGAAEDVTVTLGSGQAPIGVTVRDETESDGTDGSAMGHFDVTPCTDANGNAYTQATTDAGAVVFCLHVHNTDGAAHRFVADFAYGSGS